MLLLLFASCYFFFDIVFSVLPRLLSLSLSLGVAWWQMAGAWWQMAGAWWQMAGARGYLVASWLRVKLQALILDGLFRSIGGFLERNAQNQGVC